MKIIAETIEYADRIQPGAFIGSTLVAGGVPNTIIVYHGVSGCNIMATHYRADLIPDGCYVPIVATGITESDSIHGGNEKLLRTLRDAILGSKRKPELVWVFTSDATSIVGDDIQGVSKKVEEEMGIKIIPIDNPGFKGGHIKGADLALASIYDQIVEANGAAKGGMNLVCPYFMGSKNWPNDIEEMVRLLEAADVKVNMILTRNTPLSKLKRAGDARLNYMLCPEEMPDFERRASMLGQTIWGGSLVLPLGLANTEEWYLAVAAESGDVDKAKAQMERDMERVDRIMKNNYNFSWMAGILAGKRAGVIGFAPFAAALARYLFYDLNVRPAVIALWAETPSALKAAEKLLEPLEEYLDFEVLENPSYYFFGKKLQDEKVDFAIGANQDKSLCEGMGVPHLSLGGFYFYNQFNFVPWPYFGVLGTLNLFSEMSRLVENAFYEKRMWEAYAYKPRAV